ncbi:MAG TPA: threonine synthase [Stellaceae bacterium]|nr:threonine synthase [Stellaceae bacterium]
MRYISTRDGRAPAERHDFDDVLLAGLAPDGGLFVPESWPRFDAAALRALRGRSYAEVAAQVTQPFLGDAIAPAEWRALIARAYKGFTDPAVAPLKQLAPDLWLLELFHGPTFAFKDYALQLIGPLFDHVLKRRRRGVTIVGATSGDTGSAAIEACRDRAAIDIFMLYPAGRISEVQRRQMTTVPSRNVHAVAVEGTFDDCQDLVKAMFADAEFRRAYKLSAMNSINWARIMAQIVYYFTAALALGSPDNPVSFAVPTGNFGNVYAAHVARSMGLPIAQLVVATNRNDILARFFNDGAMALGSVEPSLSPSMDIQVSSNFERLYFDLVGRDGAKVAAAFKAFRATGKLPINAAEWQAARALFSAARIDDTETSATIAATFRDTGELIDPHSAVALAAARRVPVSPGVPMVAVATAHPAKFPDAVFAAAGARPAAPPALANLMVLPERQIVLKNDLAAVEDFIRRHARPEVVA